jgi:hypothetical protein
MKILARHTIVGASQMKINRGNIRLIAPQAEIHGALAGLHPADVRGVVNVSKHEAALQ